MIVISFTLFYYTSDKIKWVYGIGGGATGTDIARDMALRDIDHCLIEKKDFAAGATGTCHGLLHSGGRYTVKDPEAAMECITENTILKLIGKNYCRNRNKEYWRYSTQNKIGYGPLSGRILHRQGFGNDAGDGTDYPGRIFRYFKTFSSETLQGKPTASLGGTSLGKNSL